MKDRPLLIVFALLLLGVAGAWLVIQLKSEQARTEEEARAGREKQQNDRDAARAGESGDSKPAAVAGGPAGARQGLAAPGAPVNLQLRVVNSKGEPVHDPWIACMGEPPPKIELLQNTAKITGTLPLRISVSSEETSGTRFYEFNDPPASEITVVLPRKVNIHLTVRAPEAGAIEEARGIFIFAAEGVTESRMGTTADANLSAPEGNCEVAWISEFYTTGLVPVKITDGASIELKAARRAAGTLRVRSKEKPSIQFSMDPTGGREGFAALGSLGSIEPRRDGDGYVFENVPAGNVNVQWLETEGGSARSKQALVKSGETTTVEY